MDFASTESVSAWSSLGSGYAFTARWRMESVADDPSRFRLFQEPEEPPPGLEAIRAWIRKPRPRLRRAWSWVPYLLSRIPKMWAFLKRQREPTVRALRHLVRALAWVGALLQALGARTAAGARAFRDPEGKSTRAQEAIKETGDAGKRIGAQMEAGAGVLRTLVSFLGPRSRGHEPLSILPERESRDDPEERDQPAPKPLPPARRASTAEPPETVQEPALRPKVASQPPPPRAPEPPEERPPQSESRPPTPTPTPAKADRSAAAEAEPKTPEAAREARFAGLSPLMRAQVRALGQRVPRRVLHPLILDICQSREWTTAANLARWFQMHQPSLVQRHLRVLVDEGGLVLKYPENPNHPDQAYRTRSPE